ncbi:major facilitator superfamily, partial [Heterobasidion irregulare TC 32-1]
ILNRITRPSLYIGTCVIVWGLTSTLIGAAFYPGAIYLLSRWYTRYELAFRSAILYGGLLISNAFGSLIAAGILSGISGMDGRLGIRAWRWSVLLHSSVCALIIRVVFNRVLRVILHRVQGAVTMLLGFWTIYLLSDYPNNGRRLSPAERRLAQVRLSQDAGEADEDTTHDSAWGGFVSAIKDPKVCIISVMNCSQLLGLSFTNFFPTPPWIFATIVCCLNAWHADRTGERFFHIAGSWWCAILGYIIGLNTISIGGRYVALFLMAAGESSFALTAV